MTILPLNIMNVGIGGGSKSFYLSMIIVSNFTILTTLSIFYYLFTKESYNGSFYSWCNDYHYQWDMKKAGKISYAGNAFIVWVAFFYFNGIFLFTWMCAKLDDFLSRKIK
jgi:hypothetical protein